MKLNAPGKTLSVGMVYLQVRKAISLNGVWTIGTSYSTTNVPAGIQCKDIQTTTEIVNGHSGFYWLKCDFAGQNILVPNNGTVYSEIHVKLHEWISYKRSYDGRMDTGSSTHTSFHYQDGYLRAGYTSFYFESTYIAGLFMSSKITFTITIE